MKKIVFCFFVIFNITVSAGTNGHEPTTHSKIELDQLQVPDEIILVESPVMV